MNKKHTSSLDIPSSSDNAPTESTSARPTVWVQTHSEVSLAAADEKNRRNGKSKKTIQSRFGSFEL